MVLGGNWTEARQRISKYLCKPCWGAANRLTNPSTHARERLAEKLAGGRALYRQMDPADRARLRDEAVRSMSDYPIRSGTRPRSEASLQVYPRILTPGAKPKPQRPRTPRGTPSTVGFIYIIWHKVQYETEGVLKIGLTSNLQSRIIAANTWSFSGSFEYADHRPVNNMRGAEKFLHDHFDKARQQGEWFKVDIGTARMMLDLVAADFPLCPSTHQLETTA